MPQVQPPDLDDDFNAVGKPPDIEDDIPVGPSLSPSPVQSEASLWERLNTPMSDAPSRFAASVANQMDAPSLERSPWAARLQGFGAGATEGLGKFASEMTSPINLASTIMSMGAGGAARAGLGKVANLIHKAGLVPSYAQMGHGAGETFNLNPETTWSDRAMGLMEMVGGAAGIKKPVVRGAATKGLTAVADSVVPPKNVAAELVDILPEEIAAVPNGVNPAIASPLAGQPPPPPPVSVAGRVTSLDSPTVIVKKDKYTPEIAQKSKDMGYEIVGVNDKGDFRLQKIGPNTKMAQQEAAIAAAAPPPVEPIPSPIDPVPQQEVNPNIAGPLATVEPNLTKAQSDAEYEEMMNNSIVDWDRSHPGSGKIERWGSGKTTKMPTAQQIMNQPETMGFKEPPVGERPIIDLNKGVIAPIGHGRVPPGKVYEPELVGSSSKSAGGTNWDTEVAKGRTVPDFSVPPPEFAPNQNLVWLRKGTKGYDSWTDPTQLNFIYDTARMRGEVLPDPPPHIKELMSPSVFGTLEKNLSDAPINRPVQSLIFNDDAKIDFNKPSPVERPNATWMEAPGLPGQWIEPEQLNTVYSSARMRGTKLPEPPPNVKSLMDRSSFGKFSKSTKAIKNQYELADSNEFFTDPSIVGDEANAARVAAFGRSIGAKDQTLEKVPFKAESVSPEQLARQLAGPKPGVTNKVPTERMESFLSKSKATSDDTPSPIITIKKENSTPETLKKAMAKGYEVIGVNEKGEFRLRKTQGPVTKPPTLESEVANIHATSGQAKLQSDLQGSKPRFNLGSESYTPNFADDLDKALFIIAQPNPSKRDADFLKFVMKQTGMSNVDARVAGQAVREKIKGLVSGQPTGTIQIPSIHRAKPTTVGTVTPTPAAVIPPTQAAIVPPIKPPTPPKPALLHPDEPPNPIGMGEIMDEPSAHLGPLVNTRKQSAAAEAFNLSRGLMAGNDLSAPLRQGIGLIHKKAFWTSIKPMLSSWSTEEGFRASQNAIANRPMFRPRMGRNGKPQPSMAEKAGLSLTDLTNDREEALISTWAEHVPGVRRGNRAYTAFLNNLRADTFENLVRDGKTFGANGEVDLNLARSLATFVNSATGRGNLGQLESSAKALNSFFFSPRLMASRIHMLNPHNYVTAPPQVRKEMLKSLFAMTAAGNAVTQLGRMAGGTVENDPTSSDFGKLKIGNVRVDPFAGYQQYVVAANRLIQGRVKSSTSDNESDLDNPIGPYDPTRATIAGRFLRGKAHPVIGFAWSLLDAQKEMTGKQMNLTSYNPMKNAITQQFIPLIAQDTWELAKEDPNLLPLAGAAALGVGVQSYGGQDEEEEW